MWGCNVTMKEHIFIVFSLIFFVGKNGIMKRHSQCYLVGPNNLVGLAIEVRLKDYNTGLDCK